MGQDTSNENEIISNHHGHDHEHRTLLHDLPHRHITPGRAALGGAARGGRAALGGALISAAVVGGLSSFASAVVICGGRRRWASVVGGSALFHRWGAGSSRRDSPPGPAVGRRGRAQVQDGACRAVSVNGSASHNRAGHYSEG